MIRLTLPTCDICHSQVHIFDSPLLQVRACYVCIKAVADFFSRHEILETPNWFKDELLDGVWDSVLNNELSYQVWHTSRYSSTAQTYTMIDRAIPKLISEST